MRLFLAGVVAARRRRRGDREPGVRVLVRDARPAQPPRSDRRRVRRTAVERRDLGDGRAIFTFSVERRVKGAIGETVDVESASEQRRVRARDAVGSRIGLFLERRAGRWTSSLCWQVSPEDLLAAAQPLPPPNGRGPTTLLVAGRFGSAGCSRSMRSGERSRTGAERARCCSCRPVPGRDGRPRSCRRRRASGSTVRELPGSRIVRQHPVLSAAGNVVDRAPVRDGRRYPAPPLPREQRPTRERTTRTLDALPQGRPVARQRDRRDVDERHAYVLGGTTRHEPPGRRSAVAARSGPWVASPAVERRSSPRRTARSSRA